MEVRTIYDADGNDDGDESQVAVMPCDVGRGNRRGREGLLEFGCQKRADMMKFRGCSE